VDVIAIKTVGAELKRGRLARRPGSKRPTPAARGDEPEPVAVTRVTVIRGESFDSADAAREWLQGCRDAATTAAEVGEALRLLNRAIHAHRVSAGDPYAGDVSLARARRVRLGYGTGDELVEGRWRDAYEVPGEVARRARRRMLAPEEQLARILGGHRPTYPSEDLLLRARLDLDQGRPGTAAVQANAARSALEAEGRGQAAEAHAYETPPGQNERLDALARAALSRELDDDEIAELDEILVAMERFARRRRHRAGD